MKYTWWLFSKKQLAPKTIDKNSTLFDDLNNDLLLEIFDYLSFDDILLSFGNLNIHFDKLIENYPHCINLQLHQKFPNHIRSLKMTTSCQLSLLFSLQYSQLSSLRALTLGNLRSQEVIDVLNYIPSKQLEYIYLGVCSFDRPQNAIQTQILTLSQYRLRQFHLKEKLCVVIEDLPETLFALEYLHLAACHDFFILSQLLSRAPNLKYLHVCTIEIVQKPLISNVCHITHLSLRPHIKCSVEELTNFLRKCCPYLIKLIVELYIYKTELPGLFVNKHQWLTILPCQLTFFHLKSTPSAHLHLFKTKADQPEIPLREKLYLIINDIQQHYCQVIIDAPLTAIWIRNNTS